MRRIALVVGARGLAAMVIVSIGILFLPDKLIGAASGSDLAGQAHAIQDPEKVQKAWYGLVQKARAQQAQLNDWHRQARLGKAKMETQKKRPVSQRSGLNDAWRKFCKARLAMTDGAVGVSSPASMHVLDSCSSGTNLPLNRK
jgi:hypothetical protein